MAPPPAEVVQWLRRTYPKPAVDPEWLEGCYSWIQDELHLNPARDMPTILENVNTQLLESDFADSMLGGTGIPHNVLGAGHAVIEGPILVEIVEMTDIGHSAYSLLQVYESRVEYRKQAQLRDANGDEQPQKPMPKYPRSMLQFQLSDGVSVLPAIEFKNLPEFELGETPLGCKMIIKNVTVRRGTAHLEPGCIEVKGHRTADRDDNREERLLRTMKRRMGEELQENDAPAAQIQPDPQPQPAPPPAPPRQVPAPAPVPVPVPVPAPAPAPAPPASPPRMARPARPPVPHTSRSPLRGIPLPPSPKAGSSNAAPLNALEHADDADGPRRRKLPSRVGRSPSPDPPPRERPSRSRYFPVSSSGSASEVPFAASGKVTLRGPGTEDALQQYARRIGLSPARGPPIAIPDSDSDDEVQEEHVRVPVPVRPAPKAKAKSRPNSMPEPEPEREPPSDDYGFGSEFEMDENFFAEVDRAAEEAQKRDASQSQARTQTQTQVKTEVTVQSQATSATLVATAARPATTARAASAAGSRNASAPASRGTSVPNTSSSESKGPSLGSGLGEVITVDYDDEDVEKENVPVPTRHIRRRVARRVEPRMDAEIIELSD